MTKLLEKKYIYWIIVKKDFGPTPKPSAIFPSEIKRLPPY